MKRKAEMTPSEEEDQRQERLHAALGQTADSAVSLLRAAVAGAALGQTAQYETELRRLVLWAFELGSSRREWLYGLAADMWLHLAAEGGQDSEVQSCCGNIGAIRDTLMAITTLQGQHDEWLRESLGRDLLEQMKADEETGGHGLESRETFPLLHLVLDGIRREQEARHATQG